MATYYVNADVGLTGGTGTIGDPYGIETAIAASTAGATFLVAPGEATDFVLTSSLAFEGAGDPYNPVRWVGCDESYNPGTDLGPQVGFDANGGDFDAVTIAGENQIFENLQAFNTINGAAGARSAFAFVNGTAGILIRNCRAALAGCGFSIGQSLHHIAECWATNVGVGFSSANRAMSAVGCVAHDVTSCGFLATYGATIVNCRVKSSGGSGFELYRDNATRSTAPFHVLGCSAYDCVDGIKINAYDSAYPNTAFLANNLFSSCSGYAVNITPPTGQMVVLLNNGSYACTSGQVPAGRTGMVSDGWVSLTTDPFVDAASGDLALVRSTAARGAALDGGDLGALQRAICRPALVY